jgi:acid stress-induced BolA-like protein IbaG/YrbA
MATSKQSEAKSNRPVKAKIMAISPQRRLHAVRIFGRFNMDLGFS